MYVFWLVHNVDRVPGFSIHECPFVFSLYLIQVESELFFSPILARIFCITRLSSFNKDDCRFHSSQPQENPLKLLYSDVMMGKLGRISFPRSSPERQQGYRTYKIHSKYSMKDIKYIHVLYCFSRNSFYFILSHI